MWVWACRSLAMWWNQKVDCSPYCAQTRPLGGLPPGGGLVELQQEQLRLLPGGKAAGLLGCCSAACAALQSAFKSRVAWRRWRASSKSG